MHNREVEQQFQQLIRDHELLLFKVCRMYAYTNEDRQDLFQDIIVQLWQAYGNFRGDARFSTWLYRVAINTAITRVRKRRRLLTAFEPASIPIEISDSGGTPSEEESLQILYKAIEQLNKVEKAIVMLYMEDRSYQEMEEVLGINAATLRVKMNRVKEKLRQLTKTMHYGT